MDKSEKTILFVFLGLIGGCLILSFLCGGVFLLANRFLPEETEITQEITQEVTRVSPTTEPSKTLTPSFFEVDPEELAKAVTILDSLENTLIPSGDLNQIAEKFKGIENIPSQLTSAPIDYKVGDTLNFFVNNTDTDETRTAKATLQYETDVIYFWIENGVSFDKRDLKTFVDRFENKIYPINQEFFGKEWIPGVDNDPHLYIFYGKGLGEQIAGYSSSTDVVLPIAHEYSNAHEMFYINADGQDLTDSYTMSVMAHEFQHLIHGYHDANEELWLNEGFSELATLLNGYDAGGFDYLFSYDPDMQLTYWPSDPNESDAHYGASFLFVTYMLDRFGEEFTRAVVADVDNGMVSIDKILKEQQVKDPVTGTQATANDLFADWVITNYLKDSSVLDGRYEYSNYSEGPQMTATESIYDCVDVKLTGSVHQYGADYIELNCSGEFELTFNGQPVVDLLPLPDEEHGRFWWSNRGDSSDILLSQTFDFSNTKSPILMTYDTWYDIEEDYDYLYLMASVDGGRWQIVDTPSCTLYNPTGNSYGCAYNGQSDGWITETVDLSEYAGHKVELRFDYVTDGAVVGEGLAFDNVAIPAIEYSSDFEMNDGGWFPSGFALIENVVPQTYIVSVINTGNVSEPVKTFQVDAGETVSYTFTTGSDDGEVAVVISGSNRFTRQTAEYVMAIREK